MQKYFHTFVVLEMGAVSFQNPKTLPVQGGGSAPAALPMKLLYESRLKSSQSIAETPLKRSAFRLCL